MNEFPKSGNMLLILQVVDTILTKWTRADIGATETGEAYRDLTDQLDLAWISESTT